MLCWTAGRSGAEKTGLHRRRVHVFRITKKTKYIGRNPTQIVPEILLLLLLPYVFWYLIEPAGLTQGSYTRTALPYLI